MAKIDGDDGDNRLKGTKRDDTIAGRGGNDLLLGRGGDDVLRAGTGADALRGGPGRDTAVFVDLDPAGPDSFDGGGGRDTLDLSGFRSTSTFASTDWSFDAQTGLYTVRQFGDPVGSPAGLTFTGVERLVGTRDADTMVFVSSTDALDIDAGAGSDWIRIGSGDTTVRAGTGDDRIDFGYGQVRLFGEAGDDTIDIGQAARGSADGGAGVDEIGVSGNVDLARGYAETRSGERIALSGFENISVNGFDDGTVVRGDDGANVVTGNFWPSDAVFHGLGGADRITGGDGDDRLFGDDGRDVLDGAFGTDMLTGGTGADVFRFADDFFRASRTDTGIDVITDFNRADGDRIDVSARDANATTPEVDAFRFIGTAAFDGSAGALRYEASGRDLLVQGDTNGDAVTDLQFVLRGVQELRAEDLILTAGPVAFASVQPAVSFGAPSFVVPLDVMLA